LLAKNSIIIGIFPFLRSLLILIKNKRGQLKKLGLYQSQIKAEFFCFVIEVPIQIASEISSDTFNP
jgi:hypothetical protein